MKKLIKIAGVLAVLAVLVGLAKRAASGMQSGDWQKMIESMPDNAPPKWMFRNISSIRENTDRMLEILEEQGPSAGTAETVAEKPPT